MTMYVPCGHHKSAYAQSRMLCVGCERDCNKREMYWSEGLGGEVCDTCKSREDDTPMKQKKSGGVKFGNHDCDVYIGNLYKQNVAPEKRWFVIQRKVEYEPGYTNDADTIFFKNKAEARYYVARNIGKWFKWLGPCNSDNRRGYESMVLSQLRRKPARPAPSPPAPKEDDRIPVYMGSHVAMMTLDQAVEFSKRIR